MNGVELLLPQWPRNLTLDARGTDYCPFGTEEDQNALGYVVLCVACVVCCVCLVWVCGAVRSAASVIVLCEDGGRRSGLAAGVPIFIYLFDSLVNVWSTLAAMKLASSHRLQSLARFLRPLPRFAMPKVCATSMFHSFTPTLKQLHPRIFFVCNPQIFFHFVIVQRVVKRVTQVAGL